MPALIQTLFDGPLDIVGDVHGEIGALRSLLSLLGYDEDGSHRQRRRLVFLGDLTDRGPDSPAVVDLVRTLMDAGRAQCVLGNHDLNILLEHRKPENQWFWGEPFLDELGQVAPQVLASSAARERISDLFRTLPIALVRPDLRIVHACWDDRMIGVARDAGDTLHLYERHRQQIEREIDAQQLDEVDRSLLHQNRSPVKLLTSGPEERTSEPITSGGKVRYEQRVRWWTNYRGALCLFGHYSLADGESRGNDSAYCVDFGVGKRWQERRAGKTSGFMFRLAALRFPEMQVVFDDGETRAA
ncbi:MAG: metallophosphoesterase [Pirellulaceae bacterium]